MDKKDYRRVNLDIPCILWNRMAAYAERRRMTITETLAAVVAAHYKVPTADLPPRRRMGRKPKEIVTPAPPPHPPAAART
jgi:hypothetical protein